MADHIRVKRVYEPADEADGQRVLVDRVWPRGLTRAEADVGLWLREVAPSGELRKWFGHDPARWPEFRRRYREELRRNPAFAKLEELARSGPLTLVYGARDEEHNQAVVLAEFLRERLGARAGPGGS